MKSIVRPQSVNSSPNSDGTRCPLEESSRSSQLSPATAGSVAARAEGRARRWGRRRRRPRAAERGRWGGERNRMWVSRFRLRLHNATEARTAIGSDHETPGSRSADHGGVVSRCTLGRAFRLPTRRTSWATAAGQCRTSTGFPHPREICCHPAEPSESNLASDRSGCRSDHLHATLRDPPRGGDREARSRHLVGHRPCDELESVRRLDRADDALPDPPSRRILR